MPKVVGGYRIFYIKVLGDNVCAEMLRFSGCSRRGFQVGLSPPAAAVGGRVERDEEKEDTL